MASDPTCCDAPMVWHDAEPANYIDGCMECPACPAGWYCQCCGNEVKYDPPDDPRI